MNLRCPRYKTGELPIDNYFTLLKIKLQVLVNVIFGGLISSFTTKEAEEMGIISQCQWE
jgi:hypothetical protein